MDIEQVSRDLDELRAETMRLSRANAGARSFGWFPMALGVVLFLAAYEVARVLDAHGWL